MDTKSQTQTSVNTLGDMRSEACLLCVAQYQKELEICMTPRVRAIFGLCDASLEVLKSVAISVAVIMGMRQFGADIFQNFTSPIHGSGISDATMRRDS